MHTTQAVHTEKRKGGLKHYFGVQPQIDEMKKNRRINKNTDESTREKRTEKQEVCRRKAYMRFYVPQ